MVIIKAGNKVIYDLVHASLISGFTEVELNDKKSVVLTRYYESLASSEGRASRMGHAAAQENYKSETEFEKKIKNMNLILINLLKIKLFGFMIFQMKKVLILKKKINFLKSIENYYFYLKILTI